MFSVTPEPTVSRSSHGPRPAPARAEPSAPDGFASLLDGNSDMDRPASPAPEASPKRTPATEARSRNEAAPDPKPPSATDTAPDIASENAEAATGATTDPAAGAAPSAPQLEALADTITTPDDATPENAAPAADATIAAVETAIPVVVIPLTVVADGTAPTGDAAQPADSTKIDISAGRTQVPLHPGDAVRSQANGTEASLAGLPAEAEAPQAADAATTPAPVNGKTKAKAAPATAEAGVRVDAQADADAAAPPSDQPSNADAAPHGTPTTEAKHGGARQAPDAPPAQDAEKPGLRPAADHRAPATAVPSHDASVDPALHAAGQTAPPLHVQVPGANAAVAPAPQLNVMAASTMAVPLNGLAMDIALRAAGGSSRFEIRLDPAELGRIDVRLDVDKHGNVTSHLTVERPATLDMLRNDAPRLQQALEDAGLKTGDGGLQFSLRDQSSSGRQDDGQSGRSPQRLVITQDDAVPAQIAGRSYGRMLGASGGVDIRV